MLRRLTLILTLVGLVGLIAAPAVAAARPAANVAVPISGTVESIDGTFDGTFNLERFTSQGGQLLAVGTLTGDILDGIGNVVGSVTDVPVQLPVNLGSSTGSCEVLDLVLGPLDLNVLGLEVHLDTVHLNITAQEGPGNLLGNLLCAVAGLLDGGLGGTGIATLLNQILAILG